MSIILHIPDSSKYIPNKYLKFFTLSKYELQIDLVTIPKTMSRSEKIKHLTKSLIKLGWKFVEDK